MTRYFFDVRDDDALHRDVHGIDLPNVGCVWQIAVTMADEVVDAGHPPRSSKGVSVIVRDASDTVVYRSDRLGRGAAPEAGDHAGGPRTVPAAR